MMSLRYGSSCEILEMEGHAVEVHGSPCEALERVRHGAWDLVLVDRAMPEMDGYDLAREIRHFDSHLPVLMISGSSRWEPGASHAPGRNRRVRGQALYHQVPARGMAQALRIHALR